MVDRRVTQTGKDAVRDITSLCGPWGSVAKDVAMDDIETGRHKYYVHEVEPRVDVEVKVIGGSMRYLRTAADETSGNNLDNLPDC